MLITPLILYVSRFQINNSHLLHVSSNFFRRVSERMNIPDLRGRLDLIKALGDYLPHGLIYVIQYVTLLGLGYSRNGARECHKLYARILAASIHMRRRCGRFRTKQPARFV
jgi:hypothetical protein